ncbi:MAG: hypothetical protein H6987_18825, partial [Pseudomonadales bacterium]|nr:hypothetical protein [Pseudomonadales bacterium]
MSAIFNSIHALKRGRITCSLVLTAATLMGTQMANATRIETTGEPGSPASTTTISGKQLPPPPPRFGGVIKDDALSSRPWWPPRVVPPEDAP